MKSFHDLREASKQHNGRQSSPNQNEICTNSPVSTNPNLGHEIETAPSGVFEGPCQNCLVLNAEDLAQPGGHKHSMLSELSKSSQLCRLCWLIAFEMRIEEKEYTGDRCQIVMSVCGTGDDVEESESTRRGRPRSPSGNGYSWAHMINRYPSQLWVDIIDLRPWEAPEDDMENLSRLKRGKPRTFLAPDGSKLRTVGGMSLHCLTKEHDPATEFGVAYVRQVGSGTSSPRSFEVAAGWLANCLSARTPPGLKQWEPIDNRSFRWPVNYKYTEPHPDHEYLGRKTWGSNAIAPNSEPASSSAQEPIRLVEPQPDERGKEPFIRLIYTDVHHHEYAALSYCWGRPQPGDSRPWQTKQATLESHLRSINKHYLPRTLQDAIFICGRLRISHI